MKYFLTREEKFSISKRPCNIYKHQWIPNLLIFTAKGAIYHATVATVISSPEKITCHFHAWTYHVFAGKLTWYFIAVYIINSNFSTKERLKIYCRITSIKSTRLASIKRGHRFSPCSGCRPNSYEEFWILIQPFDIHSIYIALLNGVAGNCIQLFHRVGLRLLLAKSLTLPKIHLCDTQFVRPTNKLIIVYPTTHERLTAFLSHHFTIINLY